jgi:hypothetical protein
VIDKRAYVRARANEGGALDLRPFGHIAADALEGGLLRGFDPFRTPGERGSLARARAEMRRSRYDRNHDGRCDAAVCHAIPTLGSLAGPRGDEAVRRAAARIGLRLRLLRPRTPGAFIRLFSQSARLHVALDAGVGASALLGDPLDLFTTFSSLDIGAGNLSLLGASPARLRAWGYHARRVPSVDARLARCRDLPGEAGIACAARLDQYLMQRVVPVVPLVDEEVVQVIPRRVVAYSFDESNLMPAFDRIAVAPG